MRQALLISILLLFSMIGCANKSNSCGSKVLTLWPSANGSYSFSERVLSTLDSIYSLDGSAARVYFESRLERDGFQGAVAHPRYTQSGDTCVPMDVDSSLAVSVYAQFEALMSFERSLGTLEILSWPRTVGIDLNVVPSPRGTG